MRGLSRTKMPSSISLLDPYFELTPALLQELLRDLPKSYGQLGSPQSSQPELTLETGMLAPQFGGVRAMQAERSERPRSESKRGLLTPQFGAMRGGNTPDQRPERGVRSERMERVERSGRAVYDAAADNPLERGVLAPQFGAGRATMRANERPERARPDSGRRSPVLAPQFGGARLLSSQDMPDTVSSPALAATSEAATNTPSEVKPSKPRVTRRVLRAAHVPTAATSSAPEAKPDDPSSASSTTNSNSNA